jgi:hypothetical protein
MDPGSDHSYLHEQIFLKGAVPQITKALPTKTLNETTNYTRIIELQMILLPELSCSKRINKIFKCYVSTHETNTNIILGNDFLTAVGINCDENNTNSQ